VNARGVRATAIAALVLLAACTGSSPSPSSGSPEPNGPFRTTDMAAIELTPKDAPPGLGYVAAYSGDQDIVSFARDATEEQHLVDDGFLAANGVVFVPADRVNGGKLTPRDPIIQAILVVFSRGSGASSTLRRYLDDLRTRQLPDTADGAAPGLGDESYRLEGTNADGSGITVFAWRRANLVLVLLGTSFPPPRTLRLAERMDDRAATAEGAAAASAAPSASSTAPAS